jgi:lysine 2,3-aminomutase
VRYQAEDKPNTIRKTETRGVSALLQGSKSALIPENSERMARRQLNLVMADEAAAHEGNGCGGGCGAHESHDKHNGHHNGHGDKPLGSLVPLGAVAKAGS